MDGEALPRAAGRPARAPTGEPASKPLAVARRASRLAGPASPEPVGTFFTKSEDLLYTLLSGRDATGACVPPAEDRGVVRDIPEAVRHFLQGDVAPGEDVAHKHVVAAKPQVAAATNAPHVGILG